jgi:predicted ABC-type transport system involved in lysophospholipase L1 biosynthesis ATPase subunit
MLLGLARELETAVCLVTHDPSVASLCGRQLVLTDGVLTASSNGSEVVDA